MAQIVAILARGLLGSIGRGAKSTTTDLIDALNAAADSVMTGGFKAGRVFVSTSGSGQSASFLIPSQFTAEFSPVQLAKQFQEFIEIYNDAVTNGLITDPSKLDANVAAMLLDDRLQTVDSRRLDITGIRFPGGYTAAAA